MLYQFMILTNEPSVHVFFKSLIFNSDSRRFRNLLYYFVITCVPYIFTINEKRDISYFRRNLMYALKKNHQITYSPSKIHNIMFSPLNFKYSQIYLIYYLLFYNSFKFIMYLFYSLLKQNKNS